MTGNPGGPPYAHDPVGAYGNYWCRRCHVPLAAIDGEAVGLGCSVAPEPPPSVGNLIDRALSESAFDRLDREFRKGRR